jgi:cell division protein FtsN
MEGPKGMQRVRVGPFSRSQDAEEALHRLRPKWPPAKVVACGG